MILGRLFGAAAPPLDDARWVVLDVETSGLDPARDRLLAIAAVGLRHRDGQFSVLPADSFEVVLRYDAAAVDKANILLHGIGVGRQAAGVPPAEALGAFERWVSDSPLLGYHVAFDRAVIERAARQALARPLRQGQAAAWLDIAPLAAVSHPDVRAKALDDWLAHFGIPVAARHEAAADTLATAELLLRLAPALRRNGVRSFVQARKTAAQARWLAG